MSEELTAFIYVLIGSIVTMLILVSIVAFFRCYDKLFPEDSFSLNKRPVRFDGIKATQLELEPMIPESRPVRRASL